MNVLGQWLHLRLFMLLSITEDPQRGLRSVGYINIYYIRK